MPLVLNRAGRALTTVHILAFEAASEFATVHRPDQGLFLSWLRHTIRVLEPVALRRRALTSLRSKERSLASAKRGMAVFESVFGLTMR